jgi:hypothetical protein
MTQVLSVQFDNRDEWRNGVKSYDYHYSGDDAEIGDKCVVESPYTSHTIVVVKKVRPAVERDVMLKPVHCLISLKAEREEAANEIMRKAAQDQLDKMLKRQIAIDRYAALRGNPEADKLIEQLEKLGK